MANKKISALTGATTPLAGTEVLPIVQSGATVKVSVSDLTAGRSISALNETITGNVSTINFSNSTAGLRFSGGTSTTNYAGITFNGATSFNTFFGRIPGSDSVELGTDSPGAYAGVMRWGSASVTIHIGDLIFGTAAKGINFTANANAPGMTSELLNWYEEGTWTPTIIGSSTAGTGTYTLQEGHYTRIGRQVTVTCAITWTAHTGTGVIRVSGLPFTIKNDNVYAAFAMEYNNLTVSANAIAIIVTRPGQTYLQVDQTVAGGANQTGVSMDTAASLWFSATYFV